MNQTCYLLIGSAGHLQQGTCVLFTRFPHEFWELVDSTAELIVLLRIMKNIGFTDDGVCYESRESMCHACHLSKPTWSKAIDSLESKNIIVVEKQHNRPYQITLHENVARLKIDTRYRYNISHGSNFNHATKNSSYEQTTEIERIHTKWIKGRYKVKWKEKKEEGT